MTTFIERHAVDITTAADGSATAWSDAITGRILAIHYVKPSAGGFDDGSSIAVTSDKVGEAVWSESNVNASASRYPRAPTHGVTGVASLYAAAGTAVDDVISLAQDRLKFVIASGGNAKNATFHVIVG